MTIRLSYVKKCEYTLANILNNDNLTIEILDAEDIDFLRNLDITNTIRFGKHVKNCALQNMFKIY